ncbi:putative general secretory pathway K domain protein [Paraburkholderia fungorum]|uniref:General secretory pathway K domain protein n=1 Tax=Paraburkholderia fungorum TaxID=134537 RepID=A0AAU8T150_9BURK|nr:putative general secretory pathway K domain protein [Paraburkholderia fungorum]
MKYRVGARSAAGGMTALSLKPNVREHRFQMHHYRGCAGDPLMSLRCEAAFFAYFLCGGKESKCRPAQGQRQ